ncbi:hypothetical protein HDU67_010206 [Dinochytrium kinnereticum]|nr:hypothetical protein HDU67_010206 [Dinochytrium kinnereticum]
MMTVPLAIVLDPTAFKATLVATALIVLKFVITISIQGGTRFAAGTRPPEDSAFEVFTEKLSKGAVQSYGLATGKEDDKLKKARMIEIRWQRIVLNDLENIPLGLIVAWATLLSPSSPMFHTMFVSLFALARITHTVVYAAQMQPHRAVAWALGWGAIFLMLANGLAGGFGYKLTLF